MRLAQATENQKPTIIGIVVSPIETLKRIRERPIFWGAAFSLFVISLILFGVIAYYQINDPAFMEMIVKQMPQEFQSLPESERQTTLEYVKTVNLVMGIIMGGISVFLIPLIGAVLLKLLFLIMRHRKATFKQLYSLQVYLYTISVLAVFVQALTVIVANGSFEISPTSLAGVIPLSNELGKAILLGFDVFTIWSLILLKFGLVEVAQLSSKKAWWITVLFFVFIIGVHISNYLLGTIN